MQEPRRLPRRKRLFFQFIIVAATYGLIELSALVYLNFTLPELQTERSRVAGLNVTDARGNDYALMIHPYIGAVIQPEAESERRAAGKLDFTEYGFFDDATPIRKRSPGKVIVALTGGSVARQLGTTATPVLERELSRIGEFQGRSFEFVRLAIDGQKQPQQLMALNYLLTLGAEFDVLVNLDGLNEISLPGMDNVPLGIAAAYPRKWNALTASTGSVEVMRAVGLATIACTTRRDCAQWFDSAPLRYSPVATLIWKVRNARLEQSILDQLREIDQLSQHGLTYCSSGPPETFDSEERLLEYCADVWARSSILLHGACRASQIRYFHFLQPNQYLAGSKPMEPAEIHKALNEKSPFARPVIAGYPIMQAKAAQLVEADVVFTDLTQVFSGHKEPIYRDDCCHVTEDGDEIIATAIAERIKAWYAEHADAGPPGP